MYTPQSLAFYSSNSGSGWCMHDPKFLKRSSKNIQSNQHMNLQSRGKQLVFKTSGVWIGHAMPILIHILHLQIIYYINVSSVYLIKKELKIKIQTIYWDTWQVYMGFVRGIELQVARRCTEWKRQRMSEHGMCPSHVLHMSKCISLSPLRYTRILIKDIIVVLSPCVYVECHLTWKFVCKYK